MIRAEASSSAEYFDEVAIRMVDYVEGSPHRPLLVVRLLEHGGWEFVEYEEGTMITPTLRLPNGMARALLDALMAHFHGSEDARQLRADYNHERGRVDRLIDAVLVHTSAASCLADKLATPLPLSPMQVTTGDRE